MENSLFHKSASKATPPTPYELIEPEIIHLKKGYSIRYGERRPRGTAPWILIIGFLWLIWLYVMDPVIHAWYKGEAIRTYLYLHNFGAGPELQNLVATRILSADEIGILNSRHDPVQDYYPSPKAAGAQATEITTYIHNVALLHAGKYQQLDPIGRMRFLLFIRTGLYLPTSWDFLDPSISS